MLRQLLDRLYLGAGVLAALFLVAIALLILAQVIGRWFGVVVPSTEDFSGFFLAASSFLALAYTLRAGGHIRVTLLLHRWSPSVRRGIEITTLAVALALTLYAAWSCIWLVVESYAFEEVSSGYVAVPIWIPQTPMALGLAIFAIALLDELVCLLRGQEPAYLQQENIAVTADAE